LFIPFNPKADFNKEDDFFQKEPQNVVEARRRLDCIDNLKIHMREKYTYSDLKSETNYESEACFYLNDNDFDFKKAMSEFDKDFQFEQEEE
jgi:hypothetical protein